MGCGGWETNLLVEKCEDCSLLQTAVLGLSEQREQWERKVWRDGSLGMMNEVEGGKEVFILNYEIWE
jgi:hypothetical protein